MNGLAGSTVKNKITNIMRRNNLQCTGIKRKLTKCGLIEDRVKPFMDLQKCKTCFSKIIIGNANEKKNGCTTSTKGFPNFRILFSVSVGDMNTGIMMTLFEIIGIAPTKNYLQIYYHCYCCYHHFINIPMNFKNINKVSKSNGYW